MVPLSPAPPNLLTEMAMSMPDNISADQPTSKGTVAIQTHGCKLNQADSDTLARQFEDAGYTVVDPSECPDVYIINTCTVTHTADAKARHALGSAHRRNPTALMVATGCYAHRAPLELANLAGSSLVVSNPGKEELVDKVVRIRANEPDFRSSESSSLPLLPGKSVRRTRTMVKIQEGCDQICAYCIVPKVRGRERSIPPEQIIGQINQRADEGIKEVVLTGTQLGTYGFDLEGITLRGLLSHILEQTWIPRIRISSLQPQEITDSLLELWVDNRLCPHFHMPLQSGCDTTLLRMRRRYSTLEYAEGVSRVRRSIEGVAISADVIAGFPGETDRDFQESISFVESMELADMHIFPYSARPGTSAAYLPDRINPETAKERVGKLLALAQDQSRGFRQQFIGTSRWVLWESQSARKGQKTYKGLTDNYLKVHTESHRRLTNQITAGLILADEDDSMRVEVEG